MLSGLGHWEKIMVSSPQCRRTGQRQALTAIWVTDTMLAQALKRYECHCFSSCRRLSSHGSALERHRRLGKRSLTASMPPTPIYRPMWHFEVFGNNTSWTWAPPSTTRERREREKELTLKRMVDGVVAWLEDSDLGQPFLKTPDEVATDAVSQDVVAQAEDAESGSLAEIVHLRRAILAQHKEGVAASGGIITEYITSVKARFTSNDMTADKLNLLLEPIDLPTLETVLSEKAALHLYTAIYTSIVCCVAAHAKKQHTSAQELWAVLLERATKLSSCRVRFRHFRALALASKKCKLDVDVDVWFSISHSLISDLSGKKQFLSKTDHWKDRLVSALQHNISAQQRLDMYNLAKELLKQVTTNTEAALYIRQFWLYIVASDKEVPRQAFSEIVTETSRCQGAIGDRASWHLALARMYSTGTIEPSARGPLMHLYHQLQSDSAYQSDYKYWVALMLAVLKSGRPSNLQALRDVMQDLGKPRALSSSLLWTGIGDSSERAAQVLKMIVKHPQIDEWFIWEECLGIRDSRKGIEWHKLKPASLKVVAQMSILNQMIGWYLECKHLTERQVLRRIEWCVTAQQRLVGYVSCHGTAGLMKTVIADLEKGMVGRSQRLKWIMHLIEKNQGTTEASRAKTAMARWRSLLHHQWQMQWIRDVKAPSKTQSSKNLIKP